VKPPSLDDSRMQEKTRIYIRKLKKAGERILPLLDNETAKSLKESLGRLEMSESNLVILGQFKRGKSTLANCFLRKKILPCSAVPLTALITEIRYRDKEGLLIEYNDEGEELPLASLHKFVTERENPKNKKNIKHVTVFCNSEFLRKGVVLIDTPGLGSTFTHNTNTTEEYVKNCDVAVFVMSADSPLSLGELEFIKRIRTYTPRIFFVLNKMDYLSKEQLEEVQHHIESELESVGINAKLTTISANLALDAVLVKNERSFEKSGVKKLERMLIEFLSSEKETVLLESTRLKILAATRTLRNELSSRYAILQLDEKNIKGRMDEFEEETENVLQSGRIYSTVIDEEFSIILEGITNDLESTKSIFSRKIYKKLRDMVEHSEIKTNSGLVDLTNQLLKQHIEEELSLWWEAEDKKIRAKIDYMETKYFRENEKLVSRLIKITKGLFDFQFQPANAKCSIDYETDFYFKIDGMYEGMYRPKPEMLLPNPIFKKLLLGDLQKRVDEQVDKNCGRIRYDYLQRLEIGKNRFKELQLKTLEDMKKEIEWGLQTGIAIASSSISEKSRQTQRIRKELDLIDKVDRELS